MGWEGEAGEWLGYVGLSGVCGFIVLLHLSPRSLHLAAFRYHKRKDLTHTRNAFWDMEQGA